MSLSLHKTVEDCSCGESHKTEEVLLDRAGALKRLGGNENLLADLAQVFCEDAKGLLNKLRSAVESQDSQLIVRSAHALRGLASNFGAEALMHPLLQMEGSARHGEFDEVPALLEEATLQTHRLEQELARYC